ncbi:MAG: hypothetical protein A2790_20035 [Phenylobacterium sp. RIFCSPHIGHO2_01_FULL_69_31]|uniref:hypothetical protein n=1 Tax=Phenylobacterium sp. RIFCSPHIGHO2_01_FULL_69_31 TaxID=1801944 RepID=UPI0008C3733E|nr:hypothetical protein [Phenylobacterium sp. RIFCSPHIGHO2_01_FULL_69_31]OHB26258.1 MAG: hypothetical protein A2790_20035 [Phenylobacterium sp. RIFCSPHIGHO2_01_FULL_69_31]
MSSSPLRTPDGRYIIVDGRLWRASNPNLAADVRDRLTRDLMAARRAVRAATLAEDATALRQARTQVHAAKVALGERGPVWWDDGAPDLNRRLVRNTCYAETVASSS